MLIRLSFRSAVDVVEAASASVLNRGAHFITTARARTRLPPDRNAAPLVMLGSTEKKEGLSADVCRSDPFCGRRHVTRMEGRAP
jgi:hypothetical protein